MALGCHILSVMLAVMVGRGQAQDEFFPEGPMPTPDCGSQEIDLLILLDSSEKRVEFEALRKYAADVVEFSNIDTGAVRVGFVSFSTEVNSMFDLNRYRSMSRIQSEILRSPFKPGRRDIAGALRMVKRMFQKGRESAPDIVLLLTTGNSQLNGRDVARLAADIRESGVQIFATGVNVGNEAELNSIVTRPLEEAKIVVNDMSDLSFMADVTFSQICARAQSLKHNKLRRSPDLDLVFLLHFSDKLTRANYQQVLSFMKSIVKDANVDTGSVRVGAALYGSRSFPLFNLNQYGTMQDLLTGIDRISFTYRASSANAASGFDTVRRQMFTSDAGDRTEVPNAVIVITDANANAEVSRTIQAAADLRNDGAFIYSIGINLESPDELEAMASEMNFYDIENFSELDTIRQDMVEQIASLRGGGKSKINSNVPEMQKDAAIRASTSGRGRPGSETERIAGPATSPSTRIETVSEQATSLSIENSGEADLVVLFHVDPSVKTKTFRRTFLPFLQSLIANAEIDSGAVRIAFVNYANKARVQFNFNKFKTKAAMSAAIRKFSPRLKAKKANAGMALRDIRTKLFTDKNGDRPGVPNGLILITGTRMGAGQKLFLNEAEKMKQTGVKIFSIGIGKADASELQRASSGGAYYSYASAYSGLGKQTIASVGNQIYSLSSFPRRPVIPPTDKVITMPPITGGADVGLCGGVDLRKTDSADIVFAIHFNPSGSDEDFKRLMNYVGSLILGADVDSGKVRIGMYIDGGYVPFQLNQITAADELVDLIGQLPKAVSRRRSFELVKTLKAVRTQMFQETAGDRPNVGNGVILITDTSSTQSLQDIRAQAKLLCDEGITVFTIGVGLRDKSQMEVVASNTRNIHTVSDYRELERDGDSVRREIRAFRSGAGGGLVTPGIFIMHRR